MAVSRRSERFSRRARVRSSGQNAVAARVSPRLLELLVSASLCVPRCVISCSNPFPRDLAGVACFCCRAVLRSAALMLAWRGVCLNKLSSHIIAAASRRRNRRNGTRKRPSSLPRSCRRCSRCVLAHLLCSLSSALSSSTPSPLPALVLLRASWNDSLMAVSVSQFRWLSPGVLSLIGLVLCSLRC